MDGFLICGGYMNLYIYADESGVLDYEHQELFVYAGLIFLSKEDKDIETRKYISVENNLRKIEKYKDVPELKASVLKPADKRKVYRSLNECYKFGAVVEQKRVVKETFSNKKSKQRYLDYVFKIGVRRAFERLIRDGLIKPEEVNCIYFFVDEHNTATDGMYELKEGLEQELRFGTFNWRYNVFHKPVFENAKDVQLKYCNSSSVTLVRAADIVANRVFYEAQHNNIAELRNNKMNIVLLP